jgi:hypothetical protein
VQTVPIPKGIESNSIPDKETAEKNDLPKKKTSDADTNTHSTMNVWSEADSSATNSVQAAVTSSNNSAITVPKGKIRRHFKRRTTKSQHYS